MTEKDMKRTALETGLNRRTFLGTAAGMAAAMGGPGTVGAQDASPAASPAVEEDGILKSSVEGVPDAILQPPEPFQSYEGTPAEGGTVQFTHLIYTAPATARDDNQFWQEMEARLGLDELQVLEIPVSAYEERVSTLLAGGDLGDLFYLNSGEGGAATINQAIDQGAFTDLTDELTGENLQQYPNLATLPPAMWEQSKINGRIYGVPQPIYQGSNMTFYRKDWADTLGLSQPQNAEEYLAFFQSFRDDDPDGNGSNDTYAMGTSTANFISPMFRVPNTWRLNDDGTLTHMYETEEWIMSIEFRKQLWDNGTLHPDAASVTQQQFRDLFMGGQTGILSEGLGTLWGATGTKESIKQNQPDAELQAFLPVAYDGGEPYMYPLPAYYGTVAIPSNVGNDTDRMRELLRICDYMYPPFGSEEYNFHVYGIEGIHHTVDDAGARILTPQGEADIAGLLYGFVVQDLYIYNPGFPEHAQRQQELVEIALQYSVLNPTVGLYSQANSEKGPVVTQIITDATNDVVYGRQPVEELRNAVEEWRSRGGDEIRAEYEQLLREQQEG